MYIAIGVFLTISIIASYSRFYLKDYKIIKYFNISNVVLVLLSSLFAFFLNEYSFGINLILMILIYTIFKIVFHEGKILFMLSIIFSLIKIFFELFCFGLLF